MYVRRTATAERRLRYRVSVGQETSSATSPSALWSISIGERGSEFSAFLDRASISGVVNAVPATSTLAGPFFSVVTAQYRTVQGSSLTTQTSLFYGRCCEDAICRRRDRPISAAASTSGGVGAKVPRSDGRSIRDSFRRGFADHMKASFPTIVPAHTNYTTDFRIRLTTFGLAQIPWFRFRVRTRAPGDM